MWSWSRLSMSEYSSAKRVSVKFHPYDSRVGKLVFISDVVE
jgi:hypothetical protein